MKLSDVVGHSGLAIYAIVALILFVAAFFGIVIWLLRPSRRSHDAHMSRLPLEDGSPAEEDRR